MQIKIFKPDALWRKHASVVDIAKSTASNFVDTANPMSSVTEGGLLGAPVVSGVVDVLEPIWNMAYNGEVDQWKELAKGIFNWAPGSVAMKRLWDTYQAVDTGYTTTAAGRIKYPFEGTAENIARSSLFGPNSTEAGQEYVSSGYRSLSESQTRQMDAMVKQGITPSDAYRTVVKSSEASSEASKAKAGQKIGADVSEHTDAAKAAKSEMEIPVEMADVPTEHMQRDSVKKGIEIWRETGEAVYFKPSISFSKNTYGSEDRVGVERGGVFYEATPEEQEKMNQRYFREYDRILNTYDPETGSVAELKKALSNAESRIRADFAKSKGGE